MQRFLFFFFFQAEDGIRDHCVTGVQTCALPIWLRRHWPAAKRAIEFAWIPGGWDADRDGVMEGVQHNTYDVEFFGPNPLCGVWYLGALRAARSEERRVGKECRWRWGAAQYKHR